MLGEARLIDIGGRTLYGRVSGTGPAVVLNSGGGREGVGTWNPVETRLSEFATVVTYDRAGLGHSSPIAEPPTALDMAADLAKLLDVLAVPRPFVLVGTSLSGLLVQLYACQHPEDVSGLLLLDPTPDEFLAGFAALPPAVQESMRTAAVENARKTGASEATVWETRTIFESCEQVRRAVVEEKRIPNIECIVVTACRPMQLLGKATGGATAGSNLRDAHRRMAERISRGRHLLAGRSSHATIISDDADLIVETIRSLLSQDMS
ncbi:MAG TPA: alpha/beta hydrolase [Steroidobacteraceae bacterium]